MKHRILIAEDDQDIGRLAVFKLKREGWEIIWKTDGKSALDSALIMPPDLIILDIMMPVMDGYEVLDALKKDQKTQDIPVILFTARGQVSDVMKGKQFKVVDYIVKPFKPNELAGRVRKILEGDKPKVEAPSPESVQDFEKKEKE